MLNHTKLKNSIHTYHPELYLDDCPKKINFITDSCVDINIKNKEIKTLDKTYNYDDLIVAVGSETNDFGVSGVKERCNFLKSREDLEKLQDKFTRAFSTAPIAILGAGPNGLELAFEISKYYKNIKVIEALPTILPMFNETTIKMVKEELEKCNIKLLLNNKVKRIAPTIIETDQSTHFYEIAIWTCGIKPNSLIKKITSDKFSVDSNLKFKDSIYAIGDITLSGPPTAQNAKQQGEYLARFFNNDFIGPDYKYIERGKIIHTKDWIIIETKYGSFRVPYLFEPIIDKVIK
jgi:NADH dehydrogenase FAD-containing subunit